MWHCPWRHLTRSKPVFFARSSGAPHPRLCPTSPPHVLLLAPGRPVRLLTPAMGNPILQSPLDVITGLYAARSLQNIVTADDSFGVPEHYSAILAAAEPGQVSSEVLSRGRSSTAPAPPGLECRCHSSRLMAWM